MRKLLATLGMIAVIGWGAMLILPQEVPLVDRNRELLAETAAQAHCAGQVFVDTRSLGSEEKMASCLDSSTKSTVKDWDVVQKEFCRGVFDAAQYPQSECMSIMKDQQYWPTRKGSITRAWDKNFPYPGADAFEAGTQDGSRTGDRNSNERIGENR